MGKLTIAETEALQEAGVLSTEAVKECITPPPTRQT